MSDTTLKYVWAGFAGAWAAWVPGAIALVAVNPQHWPWGGELPSWIPVPTILCLWAVGATCGILVARRADRDGRV